MSDDAFAACPACLQPLGVDRNGYFCRTGCGKRWPFSPPISPEDAIRVEAIYREFTL